MSREAELVQLATAAISEAIRAADLHGTQVDLPLFPDGMLVMPTKAEVQQAIVAANKNKGTLTWWDILLEEILEAREAEGNDRGEELIQVAAMALSMLWVHEHQEGMFR